MKVDKMKYICVYCGGSFSREEMCFNTDYDCDFCQDCYDSEINNKGDE